MEAGEFATIQELAEAVGLAERYVSRQLRLAYLAPEVLKRLTCGHEASAATLNQLIESALLAWQEQEVRVFGATKQSNRPSGTIAALRKNGCFRPRADIHCFYEAPSQDPKTQIYCLFLRGE